MTISVITAVLNNRFFIEDCIKSILDQTYKDIEHIIIDGGSSDGTLELIGKYRDRISKVISEKDKGIYEALNKGLNIAKGNIIGILHADDIYMDNCVIKDVADAFQEHQTDSVYGDLIYVSNRNISRIIRYWNAGEYKKSLFERGWMVPHPSFFVKREIYEKCGNFNTGYRISADYEMMLRLLYMHEISTHYMKRTLVKMRIGGISNKYPLDFLRKMAEDFEICKAYNIREPYATVFLKNVRKIPQFF